MATPDIQGLISQAAADNNVPTELLTALLTQESSLNPNARNASTGAAGMAQLMPTTARMLGVSNPNDPVQAIPAAAKYLRQGLDRYGGDVTQALKFYYGGPNEHLWGPKTQAYPGQVMARLQPPLGISADPNSYLGIPTETATSSLGDVFNRFRNYLTDTAHNAEDMLPTYSGSTPQEMIQNAVTNKNPENFNKLFGLATALSGGGLTFGGAGAKTADLAALHRAQIIAPEADANAITSSANKEAFDKTGWFRGPDQQWRYEIPDAEAAFKQGRGLQIDHVLDDINNPEERSQLRITEPTSLGEILDHPELFAAYPQLQFISVKPMPPTARLQGIKGAMDPTSNTLYLAPQKPVEAMTTLLHESQHAIQDQEGFAQGGSFRNFLPENFNSEYQVKLKQLQDIRDQVRKLGINPLTAETAIKAEQSEGRLFDQDKWALGALPSAVKEQFRQAINNIAPYDALKKQAFDKYQRLAGEVESRNVEERYLRGETGFPLHTEGYPDYPQILKFGDGLIAQRVDHDPWLQPVEHDPFQLSPVDHDPFQ